MLRSVTDVHAGSTVRILPCMALNMLCREGSVSALHNSFDSMMHGSYHLHSSMLKHSFGLHAHNEGRSSIYKRRKLAKRCVDPVAEGQEAGPIGRPGAPQAAPQQSPDVRQKGLRVRIPSMF